MNGMECTAGTVFAGEEMRTLKAVHDTIDYLRTEWMSNKMILRCRPAGYVLVYKVPPGCRVQGVGCRV